MKSWLKATDLCRIHSYSGAARLAHTPDRDYRLTAHPQSARILLPIGLFRAITNYLSGLRILDITDIEAPVEVGYYDTVPTGKDKPGFGGSWSNYPFFTSGTIIITSMGEGLFVLKQSTVDL